MTQKGYGLLVALVFCIIAAFLSAYAIERTGFCFFYGFAGGAVVLAGVAFYQLMKELCHECFD